VDFSLRPFEARVLYRRFHADARLSQGGIRQADHLEAGNAVRDVDLDLYAVRLHADECRAE